MNSVTHKADSDGWTYVVLFLLLGYMCMGRSFAYWGIPPLDVFVGELVLGWFLLFGPQLSKGKWPWIARDLPQLHRFKRALYLLIACGAFGILHGLFAGYSLLTALRDFAFDYYPLFFLLGLWVGLRRPGGLPKFIRLFAWANGIYGAAYVLLLNRVPWTFPGFADRAPRVPVFGMPEFSGIALIGLLTFEKNLRKVWPLLLLNSFVMLGMQIRGEWLGFATALAVWAWWTRDLRRAALGGVVVILALALMAVGGIELPGVEGRGATGTSLSAGSLVGRALAPVNSSLAASYTSGVQEKNDVDTVTWRLLWWATIWGSVNETTLRAVVGFGYGFPIGSLVPFLQGQFIQTPHDALLYALAYTGWVGLLIFVLFEAEVFRVILRASRGTGSAFGLAAWTALIVFSLFEPFFEAPQGAIPFYLLMGWVAASIFSKRQSQPRPAARAA